MIIRGLLTLGIDDTDALDSPGTSLLARDLAAHLAPLWKTRLITRHQLLKDPRVPSTKNNGCVALTLHPIDSADEGNLFDQAAKFVTAQSAEGSDPGLCLLSGDGVEKIAEFGRRCQSELTTQSEAHEVAVDAGVRLQGLGGTRDGVIGALAAVGLVRTENDGRVILVGDATTDHHLVSGLEQVERLPSFGVDEVRLQGDGMKVLHGRVELGKRLRPCLRDRKVVLYVTPSQQPGVDWHAQRVL